MTLRSVNRLENKSVCESSGFFKHKIDNSVRYCVQR